MVSVVVVGVAVTVTVPGGSGTMAADVSVELVDVVASDGDEFEDVRLMSAQTISARTRTPSAPSATSAGGLRYQGGSGGGPPGMIAVGSSPE